MAERFINPISNITNMAYITKKLPEEVARRMFRVKSQMMQLTDGKVTDGELIDMALSELEKKLRKNTVPLRRLSGVIRGGKPSSPEEIDSLAYGQ